MKQVRCGKWYPVKQLDSTPVMPLRAEASGLADASYERVVTFSARIVPWSPGGILVGDGKKYQSPNRCVSLVP